MTAQYASPRHDQACYQPASGEAHTWCVSLDLPPEMCARFDATLTCDERNRSARFRFERDRQRFVVARGALRGLLGRYLQIPPGHIRLVYNACGKPDLAPEFGSGLKFNLSHSADLALIAIAVDRNIGVDLEYIRTQPDSAEIARHVFSGAELEYLNALPSHLYTEAFFRCWTKKEAYLKARGDGLAMPLNGFSVPLTTDPADTPVSLHGWSFCTLHPAPGYVAALAIEGTGWRVRPCQWMMPQNLE